MPIPPVNPSTSYATDLVKFVIGAANTNVLTTQIEVGFAKAETKIDQAIPQLIIQMNQSVVKEVAVRAAFGAYSIYLGGLETELQGLNGNVVVPVTYIDIPPFPVAPTSDVGLAEINFSGVRLFPSSGSGATIESMGPARIADLFGGTPALDPNNETVGITAELVQLGINTLLADPAWHAAMTKEQLGLALQVIGLNIIAAPPWNVNVTTELANIAAAQAELVIYQALTMPIAAVGPTPSVAARTAFLTTRQGQITSRVTANTTARNLEYEIRYEVLDSLVNRLHGVGRIEWAILDQIKLLTEQREFFSNFVSIYSAIGA